MDRIAERAGLNKRLIYYYFEDKEKLFQAVLEQAYRDIREEERKLTCSSSSRPRRCGGWSSSPGTTTSPTPSSSRCSTAPTCTGRATCRSSKRAREMNSPLIEMLAEILERGRKDGSFRGGVDPVQLYVSIAGLSYFYLSNSHTLSAIFGRDLLSRQGAERAPVPHDAT